jgi:putative transposase
MELTKYKHSVVGSNFHLQFTPKYRRDVFADSVLISACKQIFYDIAERLCVQVEAIAFGPEHIHIFVCGCKNYSASKLAMRFKGASSRFLRDNYWNRIKDKLWGDSFWTDGYFAESIGRVTSGSVIYYIERQQGKHWDHGDYDLYLASQEMPDPAQTTLSDFMNVCGW